MTSFKPRTQFQIAIDLCGMTHAMTAEYLGVSVASIKNWARGATRTPDDAMLAMRDLVRLVITGGPLPESAPDRAKETCRVISGLPSAMDACVLKVSERPRGRPRPRIDVFDRPVRATGSAF